MAVQLAAQEAKAWARIGDRRQTGVALDRGRRQLDAMPYPGNLDRHFVVDPTKFDFYAGKERAPMRLTEARVTLGVVAARQGTWKRQSVRGNVLSTVNGDHFRLYL